jgi:hypothetical protein
MLVVGLFVVCELWRGVCIWVEVWLFCGLCWKQMLTEEKRFRREEDMAAGMPPFLYTNE